MFFWTIFSDAANNMAGDTFLIVNLTENAPKELLSKIVCVHSSWIQDGKVRYKSPPYDQDGLQTIETFLQSKSAPPDSWLLYSCKILEKFGKIYYFFISMLNP